MKINLTDELKSYVQTKVESGLFNNNSEVIRQALRLLREQDAMYFAKLKALREFVQEGVDSANRGDTVDGETFMSGLLEEIKKKHG